MAQQFPAILPQHKSFIEKQRVFFVASAASSGHVNLSPKGLDSLRVLDDRTVAYLDLTGSGNETAAHLKADGRLTLMFCAFDGPPLILRLYGRGHAWSRHSQKYDQLLAAHFDAYEHVGARQMIQLDVELVLTSCGYAVPNLVYKQDRPGLDEWARSKGEAGLIAYRAEKNVVSIDGFPTGYDERQGSD